jgi:quercetin dioxygenase-like cupin family protein
MEQQTASVDVRSLDRPDEVRPFEGGMGQTELVTLGGGRTVARGIFHPGWRWSSHVKPIARTESCQVHHLSYVLAGRMTIRMDNGEETSVGPGNIVDIPPGHDAWVEGDEDCVQLDVGGETKQYAKPPDEPVDVVD